MVTVLEVGACFVHRGKAGAERCRRLRRLNGGLFLGASLEELLEPKVVLSGLGQQGWRVLLGKQARKGDSTVSHGHDGFGTLERKKQKLLEKADS